MGTFRCGVLPGGQQSPRSTALGLGNGGAMALLGQLMELSKDEAVQEKVIEVARQFFGNSNITVNLLPALIAGALLLLAIPLLLLFFPGLLGGGSTDATGSGYGAPSYGAPAASYGAPSDGYGRQDFGYEGEYRSLSDSLELGNNEASLEHNLAGAVAPIINRLGEAASNLIQ